MNPTIICTFFVIVAIFTCNSNVQAATCKKTGETCIDTTPSKVVSGVTITLAQAGGCWQYQDTYSCIQPNALDYCAALSSTPGCSQVSSVCAVNDSLFGTGCMQWTNTYQCSAGLTTPANTVSLGTSYTIASSTLNTTACVSYSSNPSCSLASHLCTDTTPSKVVNGMTVTLAQAGGCWSYTDSYTCLGAMQSTCAPLVAQGCTLTSTKCITSASNGSCTNTEKDYSCVNTPASTSTVTNCGATQYCTGGNCFNTGHVPNQDLAQTAAAMEAARQAGNYQDPATMQIFGGAGSSCTNTLFGLSNCCKSSGGGAAMNNSSIMGYAIQAGVTAGGQAIKYGSSYVYDTLFDNSYMVRGFDSMLGSSPLGSLVGGSSAGFSPSFGLYGFSVSFGASGMTFAFDPTTLAIQVGLMILQDLMSCTQDEQKLALRNGQNLCRYTGSYCSMKIDLLFASICLQTTQTYCCFNSRLARIINAAGGTQLGRAITDCSGFTPTQFAMLDFSKIDLSEFTAEIMANVQLPSTGALTTGATNTLQQKLNNYYTTGKQ